MNIRPAGTFIKKFKGEIISAPLVSPEFLNQLLFSNRFPLIGKTDSQCCFNRVNFNLTSFIFNKLNVTGWITKPCKDYYSGINEIELADCSSFLIFVSHPSIQEPRSPFSGIDRFRLWAFAFGPKMRLKWRWPPHHCIFPSVLCCVPPLWVAHGAACNLYTTK